MILKAFRKLINCIWKQRDWWKLSHCYFWRAVLANVLSPERSTEKEGIPYISYTEAIPYPYSYCWNVVTKISLGADLFMVINTKSIMSAAIWSILLHLVLQKLNKNFALFEQFEEWFCDALLSVKTFWQRQSKFFMIICFQIALANAKLVWIILSMKVDIESETPTFQKNLFLFASMKAIYKWWKMLFISS